jgi:hypothetical protein
MSEHTVDPHEKGRDSTDLDSADLRANQGLEQLGYKQELLRVWGFLSFFAYL